MEGWNTIVVKSFMKCEKKLFWDGNNYFETHQHHDQNNGLKCVN